MWIMQIIATWNDDAYKLGGKFEHKYLRYENAIETQNIYQAAKIYVNLQSLSNRYSLH